MGNVFYFQWEANFMIWLQSILGPVGTKIAYYASSLGEEVILILMLGFFYWCYDKEIGRKFGYNMLFASLAFPILKNIALRRRPYMDIEGISCLKPVDADADIMDISAQGYSFPSGHSANSASSWGSMGRFFKNKILKILSIAIPLIVGISRVCLGNHFPTDVIVGWALGYAGVIFIPMITPKIKDKKKTYIIVMMVAALGIIFCRSNDYFTSLGMLYGFFLGDLYEEKYTKFEPTRKPLNCILRIAGGGGLYFLLNTLMKMPFSDEFLSSATMGQFLFRFARYTIIIFLCIGVYPKLFKKTKKN